MSRKIIKIDPNCSDIYQKFRKELGEYFFHLRSKKNMSLNQLRDKTGMKEQRIDRIEIGRVKFDSSAILNLLRLYNINAYIILCRGETLNPKD